MYQDLTRLAKHSSLYTIGNLVYRGAAFVLIPLYVHHLAPSEYGTLEVFYITISVAEGLLGSGVAHAALRFYFEYPTELERHAVISTALIGSFLVGCVGSLALMSCAGQVSVLLFGTPAYAAHFRLAFVIVACEISKEISLAFIRARESSMQFVAVAMLQLLAMVGLNVYLVAVLEKGVYGILLGNLVASVITWSLLTTMTLGQCGCAFKRATLRALIGYSYPLMFSGFVGVLSKNADRYFLNLFTSLETVGLYALASKFGVALHTFVIEPFTRGYGPFRFTIMREAGAEALYARVMTYFLIGVTFPALGIALLADEVISVGASSPYLGSAVMVPWFLLDAIFFGVLYNVQTGVYVTKRTKYIFYVVMSSTIGKIIANALLVPAFGVKGAIAAVLAGSAYSVLATFRLSQKLLPVPYEYGRVLKVLGYAAALFAIGRMVPSENLPLAVAVKLIVLMAYPCLVLWGGLLWADERQRVCAAASRLGYRWWARAWRTG